MEEPGRLHEVEVESTGNASEAQAADSTVQSVTITNYINDQIVQDVLKGVGNEEIIATEEFKNVENVVESMDFAGAQKIIEDGTVRDKLHFFANKQLIINEDGICTQDTESLNDTVIPDTQDTSIQETQDVMSSEIINETHDSTLNFNSSEAESSMEGLRVTDTEEDTSMNIDAVEQSSGKVTIIEILPEDSKSDVQPVQMEITTDHSSVTDNIRLIASEDNTQTFTAIESFDLSKDESFFDVEKSIESNDAIDNCTENKENNLENIVLASEDGATTETNHIEETISDSKDGERNDLERVVMEEEQQFEAGVLKEEVQNSETIVANSESGVEGLLSFMSDEQSEVIEETVEHVEIELMSQNQHTNDEAGSDAQSERVVEVPKKRSIVQDIFDDWRDENPEEEMADNDGQQVEKQDAVEMELQCLLEDPKTTKTAVEKVTVEEQASKKASPTITRVVEIKRKSLPGLGKSPAVNKRKDVNSEPTVGISTRSIGRSTRNQEIVAKKTKAKLQSPRPGVRVPSRHLTSQIASTEDVSRALKERLKEKQKELDSPQADIVFVKKITQRLSNKLSNKVPASPLPELIPIPKSDKKETSNAKESKSDAATSEASKDNSEKELLAILEGDVDPDWSNLKSSTTTSEEPPQDVIEHSTPKPDTAKLDPVREREMALKQLLELPADLPSKKPPVKTRKTFKPAPLKAKTEHPIDLTETPKKRKNVEAANTESSSKNNTSIEKPPDESRSGRKRKPTERALEQFATKRQKVYKGRSQDGSQLEDSLNASTESSALEESPVKSPAKVQATAEKTTPAVAKPNVAKQVTSIRKKDAQQITPRRFKTIPKKTPQSIVKKKIAVKRLIRQKVSNKKSPAAIEKRKLESKRAPPVNAVQTSPSKNVIDTSEKKEGGVGRKKKNNELDRLLQDEGVVNLLYDVEHSDKKRLVPITKTQTKVMDINKVQKELNIRSKLVRNAVMRLRTPSTGAAKATSRSKRAHVVYESDTQGPSEKKTADQSKSPKQVTSPTPTEFVFPAKIRNNANESVIVRRHSSSSFSSTSASPRISIDGPERPTMDLVKFHDTVTHTLRSKRRPSQEEQSKSPEAKRGKKKSSLKSAAAEEEAKSASDAFNELTQQSKKVDTNKKGKSAKRDDEDNSSSVVPSRISTRSNGSTSGSKVVPAKISKRFAKAKNSLDASVSSAVEDAEEAGEENVELTACLAEAATALSTDTTSTKATTSSRRAKGGNQKADFDVEDTTSDAQSEFSNKEIIVQRHGNLVQLIMTPLSSDKIKNGITLQVMREISDTLSALKRDDTCRVVLLTSTGTSFCEGLDISTLLHSDVKERRAQAEEMANRLKEFIKCLANFNKPLVAGVQGAAVGLGVTMLPLFDLVIASDKATFNTPYGKLGQVAEGAAVFTLCHTFGSTVISELLLGGRTLTASEALRHGLVTRVSWPDRFHAELLPSLKSMSDQSSQSMEATKTLLRHSLRKNLDAALESEMYLLVQHWCSTECQTAIKAYIDGKIR